MHIMSVCRKFPHRALKLCRCVLTGWGMREHSNLERKAVPNLLRPPNGMSACTAIVLPGTQRSSVPPCPTIDHHYRLCSCKSDQGSNENSSCHLSCFEKYALTSFVDATTQTATECWTALKNNFFPWYSENAVSEYPPWQRQSGQLWAQDQYVLLKYNSKTNQHVCCIIYVISI